MQRKIHNQTLFVAALSVYFGLLIVGAPPQVLATTLAATDQENQPHQSKETKKKFVDFGNKLKALAENGKLDSFDLMIQADAFGQGFSNPQIIIACGNKEFTDLLREVAPTIVKRVFDQFSASKIDWTLRGDKTEANTEVKVVSKQQTQRFAFFLNSFFSSIEEFKKSTDEAAIINVTIVTPKNDQVFIVTRLPRANLDLLLKASEKAN